MPEPWVYREEQQPPRQQPHPPTERVPWSPEQYSQTRHLEQLGPRLPELPVPTLTPPAQDTGDPWAASREGPQPTYPRGTPAQPQYRPPDFQPRPQPRHYHQPVQHQPVASRSMPPAQPYARPSCYVPAPAYRAPAPRRKRRVFLWVFLAVQALFLIWIIAGIASHPAGPTAAQQAAQQCADNGWYPLFKSQADCDQHYAVALNDATNVGKGIGVVVIVVIWMVIDFFLGLGYGIYRLVSRR